MRPRMMNSEPLHTAAFQETKAEFWFGSSLISSYLFVPFAPEPVSGSPMIGPDPSFRDSLFSFFFASATKSSDYLFKWLT